jgi:hypothetical protein
MAAFQQFHSPVAAALHGLGMARSADQLRASAHLLEPLIPWGVGPLHQPKLPDREM